MGQLFSQLGVEPVALVWQALNFLIVLVVLYRFVYKPLGVVVSERSHKIQKGIDDAARALGELARAEESYQKRVSEAENEAVLVVRKAEQDAQSQAHKIVEKGEERSEQIIAEARTLAERAHAEEMQHLEQEAKAFVQSVVAKTVSLDPKAIDEALIAQAAEMVKAARTTA